VTTPIRIAVVGLGKIAREEHLPAIAASSNFKLVATVSEHCEGNVDRLYGLPLFNSIEALVNSGIELDAVALCTPPQARRKIAVIAIEQGWHVFLEKPPGATLAEIMALRDAAADKGISLFASWHSRFADGVEPARAWLAHREIKSVVITWREDVRIWHPGQDWIWQPGGFGVFDPGINALSIATWILPRPFFVREAELFVPENRAAPIAARVSFHDVQGIPIAMDLDFRQQGPQFWDIVVETVAGTLTLSNCGDQLSITGSDELPEPYDPWGEYPGLYRRFAAIIRAGISDVDVSPLRLVADVFLTANIKKVEPFND